MGAQLEAKNEQIAALRDVQEHSTIVGLRQAKVVELLNIVIARLVKLASA